MNAAPDKKLFSLLVGTTTTPLKIFLAKDETSSLLEFKYAKK